jgi:hypothetical protein
MDAGAGVEQVALCDAVGREAGQPGGVDLHEADVAGAVAVAADGLRIEAGFGAGDGVEQLGADAVAFAGLLPAGVCGERRDQADRDDPPRPGTPAHRLGQQDLLTRWHGRWPRSAQRISRSS